MSNFNFLRTLGTFLVKILSFLPSIFHTNIKTYGLFQKIISSSKSNVRQQFDLYTYTFYLYEKRNCFSDEDHLILLIMIARLSMDHCIILDKTFSDLFSKDIDYI